ncbi:tumor necrosis factor ligand superfamily member 13B [Halichoeres trimaculatus]|uniref:tumor necrosis factor ligand superfamily member 13B n=1 Tax=Halichoeres trimaculatus TaxID=147232 RepID=UPI003D9F037A
MEYLEDVEPETVQKTGERRLSWPVFLLTLAAITSSSLSALSLYQLVALRAEVEGLRSEVGRRREEGRETKHGGQTAKFSSRSSSQEPLHQLGAEHGPTMIRGRRLASGEEQQAYQPCLQLMANSDRQTFVKDFTSEPHTGIPWQLGLKRGAALDVYGDGIIVREAGFYFVFSQVFYSFSHSDIAMGHVVIRKKSNVVGNESQYVILFRCIQYMSSDNSDNTCYTGGMVKLEAGDHLELLIPRPTANVSLDGEDTFLGAIKLV